MDSQDRMVKTMRSAWEAIGERGGRWIDSDGVGALSLPGVPERSIMNSVIYERGADVAGAYDELESLYTGAHAWTVWVPDEDTATAEFLVARGHVLDAAPASMAVELAGYEPPAGDLPPLEPAPVERMGAINDAAYPWKDGSLERAMRAVDPEDFHLYIADDACVLGIHDCDGDAGVFFVATLPEARGRGLAGGLLAAALVAARDRGCEISTLQATKAGEPVYLRLGYQSFGAMQMWEKRHA